MRVGTSTSLHSFIRAIKDHPHACGDKAELCAVLPYKLGSSPCVWGQVNNETSLITYSRIIPMRVGTSLHASQDVRGNQDHPHACGDKHADDDLYYRVAGSSPCVWGQASFFPCFVSYSRIIPMRVGTSSFLHSFIRAIKDHPHACGDKTVSKNFTALS